MSVLDRDALTASPLADLHAIASELGLDGFRRLRKADLIDAILARQDGEAATEELEPEGGKEERKSREAETPQPAARPRRRGGRGRRRRDSDPEGAPLARSEGIVEQDDKDEEVSGRAPERSVEGTVELLGNGSGFVRVRPPEPSDDDVYLSAAQVRRCELVSGDVVAGPVRGPRRSERYSSLVRVDTINGRPADQVAEGTRFEDLAAEFPRERFALGTDDPTVRAIEWLTPFGRGSRVVISGSSRAGKSETLRRLATALAMQEGIELTIALVGVRPEELSDWSEGKPTVPATTLSFAASPDVQAQSAESALEPARRVAARGGDAVVLVDTLDALPSPAARRVLASARKIVDGGSVTVIATATRSPGGETTAIALDARLTSSGRFPALDLAASGTLRPELLVGDAGAAAIAKARAEAPDF